MGDILDALDGEGQKIQMEREKRAEVKEAEEKGKQEAAQEAKDHERAQREGML